jgi:hypothetical protein
MTTIAACVPGIKKTFDRFNHPVDYSDVLPQLETQFDRFTRGTLPYATIELPNSKPFPVYMPFHWAPVGIARLFSVDIRWVGVLFLMLTAGLLGWTSGRRPTNIVFALAVLIFPAIVIQAYIHWGHIDIPVTYETVIASFYLVLGIGLYKRSLPLIITGICLCLLSRYTIVFWIPLFFILLYNQLGKRITLTSAAVIAAAMLLFYILPFLARDPSIFLTGLRYHNDAAAFEWKYGAWTFENGTYFAPHFNAVLEGPVAHKVMITRIFQAMAMLVLFAGGLLLYRKLKRRIHWLDFSLGMLYLFLFVFYAVSPLTYRYYHITSLMLAALLCIRAASSFNNPARGAA